MSEENCKRYFEIWLDLSSYCRKVNNHIGFYHVAIGQPQSNSWLWSVMLRKLILTFNGIYSREDIGEK